MNKIVKFLLLSLSAVLFSQSCSLYNDDSETILQNVSIAQKSPIADFSQYHTYAITDSILYISDNEKHRTDNVFVQNILSGISSNMERLGYSKVESSQPSDLLIDVSYLLTATTIYYDPYYYWGWDYWWWWDGYYPYYPYYPYPMPIEYTSYYTGNVIIAIVDMTNPDKSFPIVWHGVVRSLISGSNSVEDINNAIDECFTILPPKN